MGNDGDFSRKRIDELYDAKLRNQLGNLLNRVLPLLQRDGGTVVLGERYSHANRVHELWGEYRAAMDAFESHLALQHAMAFADFLNVEIDREKPWKQKDAGIRYGVLSAFAESLRHLVLLLLPFLPTGASRMATQLHLPDAGRMLSKDFVIPAGMSQWGGQEHWKTVGEPAILFTPLE